MLVSIEDSICYEAIYTKFMTWVIDVRKYLWYIKKIHNSKFYVILTLINDYLITFSVRIYVKFHYYSYCYYYYFGLFIDKKSKES